MISASHSIGRTFVYAYRLRWRVMQHAGPPFSQLPFDP